MQAHQAAAAQDPDDDASRETLHAAITVVLSATVRVKKETEAHQVNKGRNGSDASTHSSHSSRVKQELEAEMGTPPRTEQRVEAASTRTPHGTAAAEEEPLADFGDAEAHAEVQVERFEKYPKSGGTSDKTFTWEGASEAEGQPESSTTATLVEEPCRNPPRRRAGQVGELGEGPEAQTPPKPERRPKHGLPLLRGKRPLEAAVHTQVRRVSETAGLLGTSRRRADGP